MGRYQPAVLGGLLIGVLSGLPVVQIGNVCCCLWVISGGVLVVYLLQQKSPVPVATSEAAIQGLIAGAIGGVLSALIQMALTSLFAGPMVMEQIREQMSSNPDIPPEMRDTMLRFMTGTNLALLTLLVTVPIYSVFGMAGSFLGLAFFRKKVPPQPQA